ncbi:MAG: DUF433 domain-containing protein [Janthinobacterium lividum]
MNDWRIIPNPPFADGLFSEPQTAAWEALKQRLPLGSVLTGKVYIQAPFGVFYDTGLGFPVLMNVTEFGKLKGPILFPEEYPALGSDMTGYLAQFDDNRQLRTARQWPPVPPVVAHVGLPAHPLIGIDLEVKLGYACIVGTQVTVIDVLDCLTGNLSIDKTLQAFPSLTAEMIRACLRYAADREKHTRPAGW